VLAGDFFGLSRKARHDEAIVGREAIRRSAGIAFLAGYLVIWVPALGAETLTLSNLRLEPVPVEAYGQMRVRVDYSDAQAPLTRLWVRLAREGRQAEPVPYEIREDNPATPAGTVGRAFEMGEPGPRHLTVVAEDARGVKSAPLELRFEVVEPPQRYEELTYLSGGLKIKAYLYRPRGQGPFPAIIYSHGSRTRPELQEPGRYEWLAYRLARQGYVVLVAERRGYGGSEGQGVVGGEGLNTLRWGLPGEIDDVLAAVAYLAERPDADANRVALVGKSLGGLVSVLAAAEQPRVRAVVSLAGGYGFGARTASPEMLFVTEAVRDAARKIKAATLLLHAQNDRIVPPDVSRIIHQDLRDRGVPVSLKIYPPFTVGGREIEGHRLFDVVDGLPIFWKDFTEFLASALRP
jgi:dienelactone hydrolase